MKYVVAIVVVLMLAGSSVSHAQVFQTGVDDELVMPLDTLIRKSEWWLGFNTSAYYAMNFGTLSVNITGGTAPGSPPYIVKPEGGFGFGAGIGPSLEYRPQFSQFGFVFNANAEYRYSQAKTSVPQAFDVFAYNAIYEAQSQVLYLATSLSAKVQLTVVGGFVIAGITADLPLTPQETIVWQHEIWEGEAPTNLPGAPQTSIKWKTNVEYTPRVGLQVGVGQDFMVGMFGYKGQLLTPYFVVQGATPSVFTPTMWNNINARLGVMWRAGL